jgi:hypothetical protein
MLDELADNLAEIKITEKNMTKGRHFSKSQRSRQKLLAELDTKLVDQQPSSKTWQVIRKPGLPPSQVIFKRYGSKVELLATVDDSYTKYDDAEYAKDATPLVRTWMNLVIKELPAFVSEYDTSSVKMIAFGRRASIYIRYMDRILAALHEVNPGWVKNKPYQRSDGGSVLTFSNINYDRDPSDWRDKRGLVTESVNQTTLNNLYHGDLPDEYEAFWDYVRPSDLDKPLTVNQISPFKLKILITNQYRVEHEDEILDIMKPEQIDIVRDYENNPGLSSSIILIANNRIVDGNHRALAAVFKRVPINYVDLSDLDDEEEILEVASDTPEQKIVDTLQDAGYTMLGRGADASVWTKDESTVIKIIMPDSSDDITFAARTFYKFYEFCQKFDNFDCLPKFVSIGGRHHTTFMLDGRQFIQIAMEKLHPIPEDTFKEAMVWILSDCASNGMTWRQALLTVRKEETWEHWTGLMYGEILHDLSMLSRKEVQEYAVLYSMMRLLYHTGRINKLGWDLHTENVMQRKDGTLVIIDPWFASETSK